MSSKHLIVSRPPILTRIYFTKSNELGKYKKKRLPNNLEENSKVCKISLIIEVGEINSKQCLLPG